MYLLICLGSLYIMHLWSWPPPFPHRFPPNSFSLWHLMPSIPQGAPSLHPLPSEEIPPHFTQATHPCAALPGPLGLGLPTQYHTPWHGCPYYAGLLIPLWVPMALPILNHSIDTYLVLPHLTALGLKWANGKGRKKKREREEEETN